MAASACAGPSPYLDLAEACLPEPYEPCGATDQADSSDSVGLDQGYRLGSVESGPWLEIGTD